jgi:hypothetical protein
LRIAVPQRLLFFKVDLIGDVPASASVFAAQFSDSASRSIRADMIVQYRRQSLPCGSESEWI